GASEAAADRAVGRLSLPRSQRSERAEALVQLVASGRIVGLIRREWSGDACGCQNELWWSEHRPFEAPAKQAAGKEGKQECPVPLGAKRVFVLVNIMSPVPLFFRKCGF